MPPPAPPALFAQLIASSDDAIATTAPDGTVTSWNPAAERLFGWPAAQIVGRPIATVFPPDRLAEADELLARVALGERVERCATVRLRRDGAPVHVSVTVAPLRDAEGRVVGAASTVRDIGERIAREAALAVDAQRLAAIVASSGDAIVTKTLEGVVTSWNPAAERIFGWPAAEMIGRPIATLFPADRMDEETHILARIARGERVEHFETLRVRRDGSPVHVSVTISPLRDGAGQIVGASKIARDISDRVEAQHTIWLQANFDALTRLPNRRHFQERLGHELTRAQRVGSHVAVMFIDLDHFKEVNDSLGHDAGDQLLVLAAERLKSELRGADTLARLGGDEFTVLLPDLAGAHEAAPIAHRLGERLRAPFQIGGTAVHVSGSMGVAVFPGDGGTADELLRHADQAMYECKRAGRNQMRYFAQSMESGALARLQLAADLREALPRGELHLAFQPVVALAGGGLHKFEALLRWTHPLRGPVPPSEFIPLAEETGLIHAIGDWVFRNAAAQLAEWRRRFDPALRMSVNVSPAQLQGDGALVGLWPEVLAQRGLPGDAVVVELTEGMVVDHGAESSARLQALRAAGLLIAIDDFGTGYSSLASLSRLDVSYLKIDQSFTRALGRSPRDMALCEAIVVMAHKLGLKVVAEGVETETQQLLLRAMACDFAQGYHLAVPAPAAQAEARLAAAQRR